MQGSKRPVPVVDDFDIDAELDRILGPSGPSDPGLEKFSAAFRQRFPKATPEQIKDAYFRGVELNPTTPQEGVMNRAARAGSAFTGRIAGVGQAIAEDPLSLINPIAMIKGLPGAAKEFGSNAISTLRGGEDAPESFGNLMADLALFAVTKKGAPKVGGAISKGMHKAMPSTTAAIGRGANAVRSGVSDFMSRRSAAAPAMSEAEAIQTLLGTDTPTARPFTDLSQPAPPSMRGGPAVGGDMNILQLLRDNMSTAQAQEALAALTPERPAVTIPADLGFRPAMGPGESILRAILPERFQQPHTLPAPIGTLDSRITGLQPPSPGFRTTTPAPDLTGQAYERILKAGGGKPRPTQAAHKGDRRGGGDPGNHMMMRRDSRTGAQLLEASDPIPEPGTGGRPFGGSMPRSVADAEYRMFTNMQRQIQTLEAQATLADLVEGNAAKAQMLREQAGALQSQLWERGRVRTNRAYQNVIPSKKPNIPE
jgi:hypothetical protein